MAQKAQEKGLTGPAPVVDEPGRVRNVVLVGHSGAGKTTLVDGMDAATAALWEECAAVGMPRAVAVTRLDHQRADFDGTVAECRRVFGDNVLPLYLPLHGDDGTSVVGLIGLISQRVFDYTNGYPPAARDPDPEHRDAIGDPRNELLEGIIAESEDESLMDRYLSGEEIDTAIIIE